ncbi:hypothetical protein [Cryptosporangium minutisporangium]|uniref:Uncharacterized protein n=1 Tax=Cryptosporangium minutisporangium TaxID=113569 RepID=A0ABP6T696_9ACTN
MLDDLSLYEKSLIASWRLLASVDPEGEVVDGPHAVTMSHSHPALCNGGGRHSEDLTALRVIP